MSMTLIAAIPLVLLGVVALLGFVGCAKGGTLPPPTPYPTVIANTPEGPPLAFWPLNEPMGSGQALDVPSHAHDGDYTGTVTLAQPGIVQGDFENNKCPVFGGGFVNVPWAADLIQGSFTLEAWVLPDDPGANPPDIRVVVAHEVPPDSQGFALFADANNNWVARVGDGSMYATAQKPAGTMGTIDKSSPSFLVVTFDGKTLTLWVNPSDTTQPPYASIPASSIASVPQGIAFFIGMGHPDEPTANLLPFKGKIQDVAFYTTALSNTTIQDHFNAGMGGG
jgi:hypothetical protein